jgi:hypothetical protein
MRQVWASDSAGNIKILENTPKCDKNPAKDFCLGDLNVRRSSSSCSGKMARWTLPHEQSCYKFFYSTRQQLALLRSLPCSDR